MLLVCACKSSVKKSTIAMLEYMLMSFGCCQVDAMKGFSLATNSRVAAANDIKS